MAPKTGKTKHMSRKAGVRNPKTPSTVQQCFISGNEKQLFACSRCRSQASCSKECQKADWKNHKTICQNNGLLESHLKEHENTLSGLMDCMVLVDGISMYELDQQLEKWVRFHNSTLMAVMIQALRLPADLGRARTHLLYVALEAHGAEAPEGQAGKFFRVRDAYVVPVDEALRKPTPWPESIAQLHGMADKMERGGHGTVMAVMIECPPLAVQTVPFGSMTERALKKEVLHDTWKSFFIIHIEQGIRPKLAHSRPGGH